MVAGFLKPPAHAAFRFSVIIDGVPAAVFSECTLPSLEVDVHEQKEGGYNGGTHLLPGPVKAGRITLKSGLSQTGVLLRWYQSVAYGKAAEAARNLTIVMYNSKGIPIMRLNFSGAYPVKWTGPTLRSSDSAMAIESLELAFSEFIQV